MSDTPSDPSKESDEEIAFQRAFESGRPSMSAFAQLGIRLLGIFLVVEGAAGMLGAFMQGLLLVRDYVAAGYEYPFDPHAVGWFASGFTCILGGSYLLANSASVLRNVILPAKRESEPSEENAKDSHHAEMN